MTLRYSQVPPTPDWQLRNLMDLEIQDRIRVCYHSGDEGVRAAIKEWDEFIKNETLADSVENSEEATARTSPQTSDPQSAKSVAVGESEIRLLIEKIGT